MVSSDQQSLHQELEHISMALQNCHFPKWALSKLQQNFQCRQHHHNETNSTDQQNSNTTNSNGTNPQQLQQQQHLHGGSLHTGIRGEI